MRRDLSAPLARLALLALGTVSLAWACASPGSPPGGPSDDMAPRLMKIVPDSNARGVSPKSIVLQFDEVVNERSAPTGGSGGTSGGSASFGGSGSFGSGGSASSTLPELFIISPRTSDIEVDWHRSRLEVRPRKGWRRNTTYVVQMLPGLSDLRSNRDTLGRTFVFSTGPEIATSVISGNAFDWVTAKPASGAWIEARPTADTTMAYVTVADSLGRFRVTHVPPGSYQLRALIDQNRNRAIDARELFDSATITLTDSTRREMLAFAHDTVGAGIAQVTVRDSLTLRVQFDRAVDTAQRILPTTFSIKGSDSAAVVIATVWPLPVFEQMQQDSIKKKAAQDSIQRMLAADSAHRADSVKAAAEGKPPVRQQPTRRVPPPPPDTGKKAEPPPKPSVPSPVLEFVVRLRAPLAPAEQFRLRADSVRNLLGRARTSERVFTTEKAQPKDTTKRDTTHTPRDTTRRDTTRVPRDSTRRDSTRVPLDLVRRPE